MIINYVLLKVEQFVKTLRHSKHCLIIVCYTFHKICPLQIVVPRPSTSQDPAHTDRANGWRTLFKETNENLATILENSFVICFRCD